MRLGKWLVVSTMLWIGVGCTVAPTPTPAPLPTPVLPPTVGVTTPSGMLSTSVVNRQAPANVPACPEAQALDQPIEFTWTGSEDVRHNAPDSNWTYYRCGEPRASLAEFYRRWMPEMPYGWVQMYWEERTGATMGVFFYTASGINEPNRWLYLWFLGDNASPQDAHMVAAWWNAPKSC